MKVILVLLYLNTTNAADEVKDVTTEDLLKERCELLKEVDKKGFRNSKIEIARIGKIKYVYHALTNTEQYSQLPDCKN